MTAPNIKWNNLNLNGTAELDPFDSVLNLEDQFYEQGYTEGYADGKRQSQIEARVFGFEKGFEKFVEMGKLYARARLWTASIRHSLAPDAKVSMTTRSGSQEPVKDDRFIDGDRGDPDAFDPISKPPLSHNARLLNHVEMLVQLVDPRTLSTQNNDDAVSDFDDRLKRAKAKVKVIERMLGQNSAVNEVKEELHANVRAKVKINNNIEDFGIHS